MRTLGILLVIAIAAAVFRLLDPASATAATAETALQADDPRINTGDDRVVMLVAQWCGYCRKLRSDFDGARVAYHLLDIDTPEGARAMQALGARGVPVTVIGQDVVRGYDTRALNERLIPLGYRVY